MIRIRNGECVDADFDGNPPASIPEQYRIASAAMELAKLARATGIVLSIGQVPRPPLAMGNHFDVITVYAARKMAEKGGAL